jgi:DnaJ-class molecular chaperone
VTSNIADFWKTLNAAAARVDHELNLRGKTLATCTACNGKRYSEPGYQDYDGYGPIYREPVVCRACGGRGQVEVPCAPEVEVAAIKVEMAGLRRRLRELAKVKE